MRNYNYLVRGILFQINTCCYDDVLVSFIYENPIRENYYLSNIYSSTFFWAIFVSMYLVAQVHDISKAGHNIIVHTLEHINAEYMNVIINR